MRILFLQDAGYFSWGTGVKINRVLAHLLSDRGHSCGAVTCTEELGELSHDPECEAGCRVMESGEQAFRVMDRGIPTLVARTSSDYRQLIPAETERFRPDIIVVFESRDYGRLASLPRHLLNRCIVTVHCVETLPFGPAAVLQSPKAARLFQDLGGIAVVCDYLRRYIADHARAESDFLSFPAYGPGPFPVYNNFGRGLVNMVNASVPKGLSIFRDLARRFCNTPFGAVRSWATSNEDLASLQGLPNVRRIEPNPEIDTIFRETRILLAPSLWQEAFPITVIEAMLRGIPVVASHVGGLPEAKLGTDYVLPVRPIRRWEPAISLSGIRLDPVVPQQDLGPWCRALESLLESRADYRRVSEESREAALKFLRSIRIESFEELFRRVAARAGDNADRSRNRETAPGSEIR